MEEWRLSWGEGVIDTLDRLDAEIRVRWKDALALLEDLSDESIKSILGFFNGHKKEEQVAEQLRSNISAVQKLMMLQANINEHVPANFGKFVFSSEGLQKLVLDGNSGASEALEILRFCDEQDVFKHYSAAVKGTKWADENFMRDCSRISELTRNWKVEIEQVINNVVSGIEPADQDTSKEIKEAIWETYHKSLPALFQKAIEICNRETKEIDDHNKETEKAREAEEVAAKAARAAKEAEGKAAAKEKREKEQEAKRAAEKRDAENRAKEERDANEYQKQIKVWEERESKRIEDWKTNECSRQKSWEEENRHRDELRRKLQIVGETVCFEAAINNEGAEPRQEWLVLLVSGNSTLIISKHLFGQRQWHGEHAAAAWADSDIRSYLNGEFLTLLPQSLLERFSECEVNQNGFHVAGAGANDLHINNINGLNGLQGNVFLLSVAEATRYFANNEQRRATLNGNEHHWWLRSPEGRTLNAAVVNPHGAIAGGGVFVDDPNPGIRPAMWVSNVYKPMPNINDWEGGPVPEPTPEPKPDIPEPYASILLAREEQSASALKVRDDNLTRTNVNIGEKA